MRKASDLRQRAERYRGLKRLISDARAVRAMSELADEYEMTAEQLERRCRIRERAHENWIEQGRPEGRDLEFWLAAERELNEEGERPARKQA
jgi:anti-sigma-K factor RskA